MNFVRIVLNGLDLEITADVCVAELLAQAGEYDTAAIVEVNGRFVRPRDYETTRLREGDRVEFIHAAFGG